MNSGKSAAAGGDHTRQYVAQAPPDEPPKLASGQARVAQLGNVRHALLSVQNGHEAVRNRHLGSLPRSSADEQSESVRLWMAGAVRN